MIHFTTLGSVRVSSTDQSAGLNGGHQAKRLALLCYLAIARPSGAHRRDRILGLLWPDLDQERARAALRQSLHALRKSLGPESIISHGTELIELNRSAICCDFWNMERAAESGDHALVVEAWHGELMDGLFISEAPAFEQWVSSERQRVREMVIKHAWLSVEAHRASAGIDTVIGAVRIATSLAGFDESAIRRGMRTLSAVGADAEALALYERFAADARRELDVEPATETKELAAELRRPGPKSLQILVRKPEPLHDLQGIPPRVHSQAVVDTPFERARKLRPPHMVMLATCAVVAVAFAARLAPSAEIVLDPRRVQVMSFTAEDPVLQKTASRVTADTKAMLATLGEATLVAGPEEQTDRTAGTIIRGQVGMTAGATVARAEIVDVRSGVVVRTVVSTTPPTSGTALFTEQVRTALSTALYPGWGNGLSQPPSYSGYKLFVDGMRRIRAEDHSGAIDSFLRAYAFDNSFSAAGLLAALELYQVGQFAAADSLAREIGRRRAELPPVDERLLEWVSKSLAGDRIGARAAMQTIVSLAPDAELAWLQLAIDNVETARPAEALRALDRIAGKAESGEGWPAYWATRIEANHLLGRHEAELAAARTALRIHPELAVLSGYELRALAALGRVNDIEKRIEAASARTRDPLTTMREVASELRAHGYPRDADRILHRVSSRYDARSGSDSTVSFRSGRARTLYLLDHRARAAAEYASLLREHPHCTTCMGALGVIAARGGDRATALRYETMLEAENRPFVFGRPLLLRARIAASLGDRARAASLMNTAFAAGSEFDVMTHADRDLRSIRPDSIYAAFVLVN